MCENYKYMLQIKPEFDIKFQKTGIHSQMVYLCEVKDVVNGNFKLNYDKKRFNLLVKECGQCHVCRYKKASIKAAQAQCEFKTNGKGSFITLTFGDKEIRKVLNTDERYKKLSRYKKEQYANYLQWTLEKREFQLFIKRLRYYCYQEDLEKYCKIKGYTDCLFKKNGEKREKVIKLDYYDFSDFQPRKIRYMHCGEYGESKGRPHHHAIIFGINFSFDKSKVVYSHKKGRNVVLRFNNLLSDLWPFGSATTDKVTYQSCNYVARYVTKKVVNKNKEYKNCDVAGSIYKGRLPEYCTQSNRNGLGYDYYIKNAHKINKDLQLCFKNNKGEIKFLPIPRYFKELMRRFYKKDFLKMQRKSMEQQLQFSEMSPESLNDRMYKDSNSIKSWIQKFIGDYDYSGISSDKVNYISFEYKKRVFQDKLYFKDIYLSTYKDSDFIDKEYWRITCYKNFEKYRKHLKTVALNDYVFSKYKFPSQTGLVTKLNKSLNSIKLLDNPFTKDNIEIYGRKYGFALRDNWLNYEGVK